MRTQALLTLSLLIAACPMAQAASINKDDPWNPQHISNLPTEVRSYISSICKGPPKAQHDFATYNPQEHRWRINIEYLRCDGLAHNYRKGRECLNIDFVQAGTGYRMASKSYAECGY